MAFIQTILNKQAEWHGKSLQGCLYAAYAYKNLKSKTGFERICILGVNKDTFLSTAELINEKIKDPKNFIVSIVFPEIKILKDLLHFINFCKLETNWLVDDKKLHKNSRLIKIRVPLTLPSSQQPSAFAWMLGFGPFDFFPRTRQSPFFEVLIPTKSKEVLMKKFKRYSPKKHYPNSVQRGGNVNDAHVADIHIEGITNNLKIDPIFWSGSINRKHQILTNSGTFKFDDTNAKAKVTFSYPESLANDQNHML